MQSRSFNNEGALVSIIIPVYNVEQYLNECINSVTSQTYTNLEILLIDDGSTDNSPVICDSYAENDFRIKVLHKQNGGLSDARNVGMEICTGEFVYFLDSDDYIEKDTIEKLVSLALGKKLEFVIFDAVVIDENGNLQMSDRYIRQHQDENVYDGRSLFSNLIKNSEFIPCIPMMFFSKAALRTKFRRIIHEDELFSIQMYYNCSRVAYLNAPLYYRRIRNDSIMTTVSKNHYLGYLEVIRGIDELAGIKDPLAFYIFRLYGGSIRTYLALSPADRKAVLSEKKKIKKMIREKKYYGITKLALLLEFEKTYYYGEALVRKIFHRR